MKFFIGLVLLAIGLLVAIKYKKLTEIIGFRIGWAERYIGGTSNAYFLFGMIGAILGFLILLGVIDLGIFGL